MNRRSKVGAIALLTIATLTSLGLPSAGSAPVVYSPTPVRGWSTNAPVRAVLIVGNTAYAAGDFTELRGPGGSPTVARSRLAAFDLQTGALRTAFQADVNARVHSLATDGTSLFVGGNYTTIKGVNRTRLASVNLTTGNVNTGFSAGASSHVYGLAVKGDRLYVGGAFNTLGGQPRAKIGAVSTTTGALDPLFNPGADEAVHAIAVAPDGNTVYPGGDFTTIAGAVRPNVAALSATTGALLPVPFQYPTSHTFLPQLIDLDISPSGDRLFAALGGDGNQAISWSTVTGRRQWGRQVDGDAQAVRYISGNVYLGFHEGDIGDDTVRLLAADATTGISVPTFRPTANSFYGVWDIDASPSALVIGGEFTNFNGVATQGIAILPRTTTDPVVPGPPSNLRVTGTTSTSIALAWNPGTDNIGVAGYRVLRNGVEVAFPTGLTFTETDLPAATDFTYEVQTVDAAGNVSSSVGPIPAGTDLTLVPAGATWRYLDNGSNQGTAWRAGAFNDTAWASGPAQLGYGDGDEATVVSFGADPNNRPYTTYFRRQLTIDNPGSLSNVNLTLLRDDGAVVYLNGVEIARSNMPNGNITFTTAASTNVDGAAESQLFGFPVDPARFVAGTNTLAVEIHQNYRSSSDISFDLILSTGRVVRPLAPTNLRTTAVGGTSVGLAWDAPSGSTLTGYRVYRDGVLVGSPSGTTLTDTGLASVGTYSYTVTAVNHAGAESAPTAALAVTTADVIAPSSPTGLAAPTVSGTRVVLTWSPSTDNVGVTGYEVRRAGTVIASPSTPGVTDFAVAPNRAYSYTVRARDAAGNFSAPTAALEVTTPDASDLTPPSAPQNLRSVTRSTTQLSLAWDPATDDVGVTGYVVARNGVDLPVTQQTSFTDTLLAPGATYTYTVRALDAALNTSTPSAPLVLSTHLAVETAFASGSVWRYTDDGVNRGTAWRESAYNDSTWKSGPAQLGYGDGDEATVMFNGGTVPTERWISHYLRRSFTVADADQVSGVTLSVLRDDGVVVYVNGVEALRDNVPAGTITNTTFASTNIDGAAESTYNDFVIPTTLLREGSNVIAVSLHQDSRSGAGDLSFDARMTLQYAGGLIPAAPTNLRNTATTGTTADLTWDAPSGTITGYRVYRGGVLVGSLAGTTFGDTGLTSAQTYSYAVSAITDAGIESSLSAPLVVTTPDVVAPSTPAGLAAPTVSATSVGLSWSASTDNVAVTGYTVLRDGTPIATPTTTTYTDPTIAPNTTYSYTVRARDAAGNLSPPSDPVTVTTPEQGDITPPSVPQNLRTTNVASTEVALAWDASTDDRAVTDYLVTRNGITLPATAATTLTDGLLSPGVTYTYTVRARDAALNTSAASVAVVVTTPDVVAPSVPTGLAAPTVTPTSVRLTWNAATDDVAVTGYTVLRDGTPIATPTTTTYTDPTVVPNTTYTYTVRARDAAGNFSTPSDAVTVTTPVPDPSLFSDLFLGANGAAWGTGWTTSVSAGTATQQTGTGQLALTDTTGAYSRAQLSGLAARTSSETLFSYQFNSATAAAYFSVFARGSGGWQNGYRPQNGYGLEFTSSSGTVYVKRNASGVTTTLATVTGARQVSTAKQWVRLRVSGTTIQLRTWIDGQPEPATWSSTLTDTTVTAPGQLHLSLVRAGANTGLKNVQIDDLRITDNP